MYYLYKWSDLKPLSPQEDVRNKWLYEYGAFGCYNGIWFPCTILNYNYLGNPVQVTPIPLSTVSQTIYPSGPVNVSEMEVLYSVFNNGLSIHMHILAELSRKNLTKRMLDAGTRRSLNTELIYAPKNRMRDVKQAVNREDKRETYVIDGVDKETIGAVALPRTIEVVEKLWNSYDWAVQDISQALGISYNPAHGKKERMIQNELMGDRDLTLMNREMLTQRLITSAEKFGEFVCHISSIVDTCDRNLSYGVTAKDMSNYKFKLNQGGENPDGNDTI